jgi:VanZ family protein
VAPDHSANQRRFAALTAGVMALILYGSLYPFRFFACAISPAALLATSGQPADRGDLLANVLLYVPLGFFGLRALRRSGRSLLLITLAGAALSFAIETAQFCDSGRVPSMADVYANSAGTLLGAVAALWTPGNFSFAALLLACWTGSRLLPYVPSIHLHKYWIAIRPVLVEPKLEPLDVFHYFALWLAAAVVLEAIAANQRWTLPLLMGGVLTARIVIVDLALAPAEILGALLAAIAWIAVISRLPSRAAVVAATFAAFVIVQALAPFHFLAAPRHFGWIPFLSFMQSPRENGSRVFLEKSFTYGALVWLLTRAGMSFSLATTCSTALVFCLRLAQIYLPGRSAEITDALMILMFAAIMKLMELRSP